MQSRSMEGVAFTLKNNDIIPLSLYLSIDVKKYRKSADILLK